MPNRSRADHRRSGPRDVDHPTHCRRISRRPRQKSHRSCIRGWRTRRRRLGRDRTTRRRRAGHWQRHKKTGGQWNGHSDILGGGREREGRECPNRSQADHRHSGPRDVGRLTHSRQHNRRVQGHCSTGQTSPRHLLLVPEAQSAEVATKRRLVADLCGAGAGKSDVNEARPGQARRHCRKPPRTRCRVDGLEPRRPPVNDRQSRLPLPREERHRRRGGGRDAGGSGSAGGDKGDIAATYHRARTGTGRGDRGQWGWRGRALTAGLLGQRNTMGTSRPGSAGGDQGDIAATHRCSRTGCRTGRGGRGGWEGEGRE